MEEPDVEPGVSTCHDLFENLPDEVVVVAAAAVMKIPMAMVVVTAAASP